MRHIVVLVAVAIIIAIFSFFAVMKVRPQPTATTTATQTPVNTLSSTSTQASESSTVGQIRGWLIEVRHYYVESRTNKTVEVANEKYYYWDGILYKYDNGSYWKMGKVDTIVVKNFTKTGRIVGGYSVIRVTFLPYNGGPPPTNDTVIKAHFQALYTRGRTYGYNIAIETQYSELLAALNAICIEPGNKIVTLPFANVTVDYRIISIVETDKIYAEKIAISSVNNACAINPRAVDVEKYQ